MRDFDAFTRRLSRGPERAHLSFLHVQLPHSPYDFLPTGQRYPKADCPGRGRDDPSTTWSDDRWLARQGLQRYLLQLALHRPPARRGNGAASVQWTLRRALVVVAADHGVSFLPRTADRHAGERNFAPIASVPLFIKAPGQRRGSVDDSNVQTIDLLPTVAARLGVRLPWSVEGRAAGDRKAEGRVAMRARQAGPISVPFRTFVRRRDLLVRRMAGQFRPGVRGLYAGGPDADLLGRRVEALGSTSSRVRVAVDDPNGFDAVDPYGPLVPALIGGEVARLSPGARLALAVNGRVVGTTIPYRSGGAWSFTAMVAPEAFSRGRNSVELLALAGSGGQRRITRFQTPKTYRLVRENGRATIVNQQARRFRVAPGAVQGYIDALNVVGPGATISGWAGTTSPPRAADRVAAFVDGRFLKTARPVGARPDLKSSHGPGLARAGFRIVGRVEQARRASLDSDLEVFAILNGRATRLTRAPRR